MPWHCEPVVYYDFLLTILLFFSTSRACFFLPVRASSGAWFYFNFDPFPLYVYVSTPRTGYTFALRPSVKGMKDNVEWTVFCCWKWVGEKFKNGFFWCSHFLGELVCMPLEYRWKVGFSMVYHEKAYTTGIYTTMQQIDITQMLRDWQTRCGHLYGIIGYHSNRTACWSILKFRFEC